MNLTPGFKGISDHGALSGLLDDDHTQYILADGSRAFTGNQSFGDFNITNVGIIDLDVIRADTVNSSITIALDNAAGADLLIGNNNALVVEGDTDRVGIGISAPEQALHIKNPNRYPFIAERSGLAATTGAQISMAFRATSTGNMTDNFGPMLVYEIEDDAGVANEIAAMGGVRNGTDDSGRITFWTKNFGTFSEKATITAAGLVGINDIAPDAMLEVKARSASEEGIHVKAAVSQTADLQTWTDSNDVGYLSVQAAGDLNFAGGVNILFSTVTGTKIGGATNQLIGFWNATPVIQPSGVGETVGFTAGAGTGINDDSTFTGNVGSTAYRISDIVKALKNVGLLAQ